MKRCSLLTERKRVCQGEREREEAAATLVLYKNRIQHNSVLLLIQFFITSRNYFYTVTFTEFEF